MNVLIDYKIISIKNDQIFVAVGDNFNPLFYGELNLDDFITRYFKKLTNIECKYKNKLDGWITLKLTDIHSSGSYLTIQLAAIFPDNIQLPNNATWKNIFELKLEETELILSILRNHV